MASRAIFKRSRVESVAGAEILPTPNHLAVASIKGTAKIDSSGCSWKSCSDPLLSAFRTVSNTEFDSAPNVPSSFQRYAESRSPLGSSEKGTQNTPNDWARSMLCFVMQIGVLIRSTLARYYYPALNQTPGVYAHTFPGEDAKLPKDMTGFTLGTQISQIGSPKEPRSSRYGSGNNGRSDYSSVGLCYWAFGLCRESVEMPTDSTTKYRLSDSKDSNSSCWPLGQSIEIRLILACFPRPKWMRCSLEPK